MDGTFASLPDSFLNSRHEKPDPAEGWSSLPSIKIDGEPLSPRFAAF